MRLRSPLLSLLLLVAACAQALAAAPVYYDVPKGSHPHDVAADPAPGGAVYYTAQHAGKLGILDPKSGRIDEVPLGARSSPHEADKLTTS